MGGMVVGKWRRIEERGEREGVRVERKVRSQSAEGVWE